MELAMRTASADETRDAGEAIAPLLQPGDTVVLCGDLGAGKTTLVQGVARGLDIDLPVQSPTFMLVKEYDGAIPLTHADVFRLDRVQDVVDLGLEESEGVVLVEWGDMVEELFPPDRLRIEIATDDDGSRRFRISGDGRSWSTRWERLEQALDPWVHRR